MLAANDLPNPHEWPAWLFNTIFPLNRWLHLVASTLIVGGVLFFEFVVPLATADLKEEQQLAVFGRARWVFRRVVWISLLFLLITGAFSLWRMWSFYKADEKLVGSFWLASRPWVYLHVLLGLIGFALVLRVTNTRRLHGHPIGWLRAALVFMLACMFAVSIARQVRMHMRVLQDMQQPDGEGGSGGSTAAGAGW
jgi:uncharacterized membrane protein